jgi:hypothetical protein
MAGSQPKADAPLAQIPALGTNCDGRFSADLSAIFLAEG